jgi:phosphatidylglycerol---prolipoprotein diacylglyceryl transferase
MLDLSSLMTFGFEFTSPGASVQLGPISVRWYGVIIAIAVLLGMALSHQLARRRKVAPELVDDLVLWLIVGAIPGARLYYVAFQWDYYRQHLDQIPAIWKGGIAIHGAILGGVIAAWIYASIRKCSFWMLADLVAPSLILGQAIGRWGNFFNSEAFGGPTQLPWKLLIPEDRRPPGLETQPYYHPTFLYESVWNLLVFGLLMTLFFRMPKAKRGTLFCVYAIAYSLGRLWIEALRTDSLMFGPIKTAQFISLIGIVLGLGGLVWLYILNQALPDVKEKKQARVTEMAPRSSRH